MSWHLWLGVIIELYSILISQQGGLPGSLEREADNSRQASKRNGSWTYNPDPEINAIA